MRPRRPSRPFTLLVALCALALVSAVPVPAGALPTTGLSGFVALPDGAVVEDAAASPARNVLAVMYSVENLQGLNELWILARRSDVWGSPVRVSDPAADAFRGGLDVGPSGAVEVAWVEIVDDAPDVVVARSVGTNGAGPRRVIDANPANSVHVAAGNGQTVVVWDEFSGGRERVRAARSSGDAFLAPEWVTDASTTRSVVVTDAAAGSGLHVGMRVRSVSNGTYLSGWAVHQPDGWHDFELPQSFVNTAGGVPTEVAVNADGTALILHAHSVSGALQPKAHLFNADPNLILAPGADVDARLVGPVAVGSPGSGVSEAIVGGAQLLGVLGNGIARTGVSSGTGASVDLASAPAACGTRWVLTEVLDFICFALPDPFGSRVDLTDAAGNSLGSLTPSEGATQVTARSIRSSVPVLVVREVRPGPDPQWLLDVGSAGIEQEPPPPPPPTPTPITFTQLKLATVTGKLKVGRRLTAKPGSWSPAPAAVGYRWFANGKRIKKASKPKLKLVKALQGKRISVRVTLTRPSVTSRAVTVNRSGRVR